MRFLNFYYYAFFFNYAGKRRAGTRALRYICLKMHFPVIGLTAIKALESILAFSHVSVKLSRLTIVIKKNNSINKAGTPHAFIVNINEAQIMKARTSCPYLM